MRGNLKTMNLNKRVKRNLNELNTKKKTRLIESEIIKSRFTIIAETVDLNSNKHLKKFFFQLFKESRDLVNMGLSVDIINEDLITVLKGVMGDQKGSVIEKLKEKLINYLDMKLQIDGFEKDVLTIAIEEMDDEDFPKIFSDKRFLSRKISDVFVNEFKEKYLEGLTDTTKEIVMNQIDNNTFKRELEDKYTTALESLLDTIESNMDSKLRGIRDKVFS